MTDLCELLYQIKQRPGMFLDTPSIKSLQMLMMGYNIARRDQNIPLTKQELEFQGFQQWVQDKYNVLSSKSWATIILENSQDERDAFDKFFELFEEFTHEISKAEISQTS
jgi:hypothetical protein